jgi:3',5'-cyclic-AMP phosphodiesterase
MTSPHIAFRIPEASVKAGIVSWAHFGDLHMTVREEKNFRDFLALVDEVNEAMADSLNFAYLPGDNADHGRSEEYGLVREGLDRLRLPWVAITGDHDVQQRSHANFLRYMMPEAFYSFEIGRCRFFALDCFAADDPTRFDLSGEQIEWLGRELASARSAKKDCVLFLHCYPSELGESSAALRRLIRKYGVLLVDMGHTHYNEIAHDGRTLYTATRSTGQVEEGPVGLSITNVDNGTVSWKFKPLGEWPLVMITAPADARLMADDRAEAAVPGDKLKVRVKGWSTQQIIRGFATLAGESVAFELGSSGALWEAELDTTRLPPGNYRLSVELTDRAGRTGRDAVHVVVGSGNRRALQDGGEKDHPIGAWAEHGILGTQLGPNKNGRKW